MKNKTSVWAGGAAVAVLLVFAAAYFLLIGPVMDSTAETDDERTQVEAQNQTLRSQNATLRGQFENIDQLREQLGVLQEQVPAAAEWDTFTTMVGNFANDNGVVITNITGAPAVAIAGTAPDAAAAPPDDAAATPDAVAPTAAATGQAIPVTIKFQGPPVGVIGTINSLQAVDQRLLLVQAVNLQGLKASADAMPPVAEGDASGEITGYIFIQPPVVPVPDQVAPAPWAAFAPFLSPA
ncbi:MAG: hypothetical protein LBU50_01615 [Cellulomonas sp.]|jgi:hypothetical protein|nr:hypothetical protein [Cellulomonas sp.]